MLLSRASCSADWSELDGLLPAVSASVSARLPGQVTQALCRGVEALVVEPEESLLLSECGSSRSPPMSSWLRFNCTFNRFLPS